MVILYQVCSSHHDSSKKMAARGRDLFSLYIYIKKFETLFVRNHRTDFNITWQKCSFDDPLPRLFKLSYIYIINVWNLLGNHGTDFNIILQKHFDGDSLPRLCKPSWFIKKHGGGGVLIFPIYLYRKLYKNLIRNNWKDFSVTWQKYFFGDPLPRLFKPSWFVKRHGRQGAGLIYLIYLYRKL